MRGLMPLNPLLVDIRLLFPLQKLPHPALTPVPFCESAPRPGRTLSLSFVFVLVQVLEARPKAEHFLGPELWWDSHLSCLFLNLVHTEPESLPPSLLLGVGLQATQQVSPEGIFFPPRAETSNDHQHMQFGVKACMTGRVL